MGGGGATAASGAAGGASASGAGRGGGGKEEGGAKGRPSPPPPPVFFEEAVPGPGELGFVLVYLYASHAGDIIYKQSPRVVRSSFRTSLERCPASSASDTSC
jgi:hypothetical protein